jgi:phage regulator Rha-like protein
LPLENRPAPGQPPAVASVSGSRSPEIVRRIRVLRGQRVLLDTDLAALYGVPTKVLNQAIRRNSRRLPPDFLFRLTPEEWNSLRSQNVTLETGRGRHRKYPPFALTEHGAIMAANVLSSEQAIEMAIYVVRAFVRLRQLVAANTDLARKLSALERSMTTLDAETRHQFRAVYRAIRALTKSRKVKSRPIGFTVSLEG